MSPDKKTLRKEFSKAFKKLKETKGIAHADIHAALKIPYASLWHWNKGTCIPRAWELTLLADYFGCSVDELLGR